MSWDFCLLKGSPREGSLRTLQFGELHPVGQVAAMAVNPQSTLKGGKLRGRHLERKWR